jgi:hypothetical protein
MELESKARKFTSLDRRNIVFKISKLKNKKHFVTIYNLIQNEMGNNISINRNGIFFNINMLSDQCLYELSDYLNDTLDSCTETETKIKYHAYSVDDLENVNKVGPKLSNQEKSIIKKITKI